MSKPDRKTVCEALMKRFGPCRCASHCQVEQHADEDMQDKPGGRYSVCEIEAEKLGIPVPPSKDHE
jgi:hypothetical protein